MIFNECANFILSDCDILLGPLVHVGFWPQESFTITPQEVAALVSSTSEGIAVFHFETNQGDHLRVDSRNSEDVSQGWTGLKFR